MGYQKVKAK